MEIDTHALSTESETDGLLILLTLLAGIAIGVVALWTIETADSQPKARTTDAGVRPFAPRGNGTAPKAEEEVTYHPPADLEVKPSA